LPGDVAAELLALEMDEITRIERAAARSFERVSDTNDTEHTPTCGDDPSLCIAACTGVIDRDIFELFGFIQTCDDITCAW